MVVSLLPLPLWLYHHYLYHYGCIIITSTIRVVSSLPLPLWLYHHDLYHYGCIIITSTIKVVSSLPWHYFYSCILVLCSVMTLGFCPGICIAYNGITYTAGGHKAIFFLMFWYFVSLIYFLKQNQDVYIWS